MLITILFCVPVLCTHVQYLCVGLNLMIMENAIVISRKVISRMKNMSDEERRMIFDTFACDEIFNISRNYKLSPVQELLYSIIKDLILRDSKKIGICE